MPKYLVTVKTIAHTEFTIDAVDAAAARAVALDRVDAEGDTGSIVRRVYSEPVQG